MTFVFNASPLIVLAKAGLLERMLGLPECVRIPNAVAREVRNCAMTLMIRRVYGCKGLRPPPICMTCPKFLILFPPGVWVPANHL